MEKFSFWAHLKPWFKYKNDTLEYPISVGVRLLIFQKFSTQHALIPYHTFINFMKKFQPIRLFHIVWFSYSIFFPWRCRIITQIVSKCHDRANLLPNLQKFRIIEKISTQFTIIPPNMFIVFWIFSTQYDYPIPYVYFSGAKVHPIRLFHTIRLLILHKLSTQYVYSIPYAY